MSTIDRDDRKDGDSPRHSSTECDLGVTYEATGVRWCNYHTLEAERDALADRLNDAVLYERDYRDALARQTPHLLKAEAERDALAAAVQRVRDHLCQSNPCPTILALDGPVTP